MTHTLQRKQDQVPLQLNLKVNSVSEMALPPCLRPCFWVMGFIQQVNSHCCVSCCILAEVFRGKMTDNLHKNDFRLHRPFPVHKSLALFNIFWHSESKVSFVHWPKAANFNI